MLEFALAYAKRGWSVLPLHSIRPDGSCDCDRACDHPGKHPRLANGHHGSTTHEPMIRYWWAQWPESNIGISVEHSNLAVLDVDVGEGKQGRESLEKLERDHGELPPTLASISGGGGLHALFALGDAPAGRKCGFADSLDLLSKGYIVAPPSRHVSGNTYRWVDPAAAVAPLPGHLRTIFAQSRPEAPPSAGTHGGLPATPAILKDARERLLRHGPAVSGQGGDAHTFQVGAILFRGYGLTFEDAWPLALEWNASCQPPWAEGELATKLRNGQTYGSGGGEERARVEARAVIEARTKAAAPPVILGPDGRRAVRLADAARRPKPPLRWYTSGMRGLDEKSGGGLASRTLQVLLGPPGVGKTGFAVSVGVALAGQLPVLHVSTELETDEVAARYGAHLLKVPWTAIERGRVDIASIINALEALHVRCIGCDVLPRDLGQALAMITEEAAADGAGVIVDYLQDMIPATVENQKGAVGEAATSLREISQVLDVPVFAVSSVARTWYTASKEASMREANDPRAYLAAAKESGGVDYAAASIYFLDVNLAEDGADYSPARVVAAKVRRGQPGFVGARFYGARGGWEYAPEELTKFKAPSSGERIAEEQRGDDAAVMTALTPLLSTGLMLPIRDLREQAGIPQKRAVSAITRLLAAGKLARGAAAYDRIGLPANPVP